MLRKRFESSALLIFGMVLVAGRFALAQSQHTLTRKSERTEFLRTDPTFTFEPAWNGHFLIGIELNRSSAPIIWTIDANGRKEEIEFSIPEAAEIIVWNLAGSADGTVVVGGTAVGGDSQGSGFVGIIPPDRSRKTVVRTYPFIPYAVTVAPDGVIWAAGWNVGAKGRDYSVLARFDSSGRLLSSRVMNVKGTRPANDASYASTLRSSGDRVGWLTAGLEYVEFKLDGQEAGRFAGPPWIADNPLRATIALRNDDEVIAAAHIVGNSMWALDRAKRSWSPVQVSGGPLGARATTYGFDGDDLMVGLPGAANGNSIVRFRLSLANTGFHLIRLGLSETNAGVVSMERS
jgi:hypothetical protein